MSHSRDSLQQVCQSARHRGAAARRHHRRVRAAVVLAALAAAVLSGGCSAVLSTGAPLSKDVRERSAEVVVHGESLTLHLASPRKPPSASMPLVLYASGDGGWFGAAAGMFHTIASSEYPTVGFSSKDFMRIEQKRFKPLSVAHLAQGYEQIIEAALTQLRLAPETPIVLTGWSRGAALGVLVASRRQADSRVVGLVAIGLPADEQLDIAGDTDDDAAASSATAVGPGHGRARPIALYPLLSRVGPRRVVVVQASGDGYLPAARARELFGSDSASKRLIPIDGRNHRFSGGESSFAAALVDAVAWVASGGK
jgi:pimeloyl-ACP methyl ester carboxylesterase